MWLPQGPKSDRITMAEAMKMNGPSSIVRWGERKIVCFHVEKGEFKYNYRVRARVDNPSVLMARPITGCVFNKANNGSDGGG